MKLKTSSFIIFILFSGLILTNAQIVRADEPANNLGKATINILAGWTEVAIYPTQEAAKPGWLGKIMFPVNVGLGAVKGAVREFAGAADFLTFWKDKNLADSWPGKEF